MKRSALTVLAAVVLLAGFAPAVEAAKKKKKKQKEVVRQVVVQHILISFKGSNSRKQIARSKKQAERLAYELLERAQTEGEDFDALVQEYTDDKHPGIYTMANKGLGKPPGGVNRMDMVPEFGDVSFELEVGEVGIARYSAGGSPYGFHIIKRLE